MRIPKMEISGYATILGGVWETNGQAPALLANGNAMSETKDFRSNCFLAFTQTSVVGWQLYHMPHLYWLI